MYLQVVGRERGSVRVDEGAGLVFSGLGVDLRSSIAWVQYIYNASTTIIIIIMMIIIIFVERCRREVIRVTGVQIGAVERSQSHDFLVDCRNTYIHMRKSEIVIHQSIDPMNE